MPLFTFHQSRWSLFRPRKSRTFKAGCPTLLTECASGKDDGRFAQLRGHWAYKPAERPSLRAAPILPPGQILPPGHAALSPPGGARARPIGRLRLSAGAAKP